jgi:hypothetical protein
MTQTRKSRAPVDNAVTPPPSTTSTPSSSQHRESTENPLPFNQDDTILQQIHSDLQNSDYFLGSMDLSQHVEWVNSGRQQVLVQKRENPGDRYEPAILEFIAEVSPNNFWLYACAGWNGERGPNDNWEKASPFEKAKARAFLRRPSQGVVASDWKPCLANLHKLMMLAKKKVANTELSLVQDEEVKIRHAIFEVCHFFVYIFIIIFY